MKAKWIQEYFLFTKKERIAVISLIALIVLVFFLPNLIQTKHFPPSQQEMEEVKKIAQQIEERNNNYDKNKNDNDDVQYAEYRSGPDHTSSGSPPSQLFYFDPNKISEHEWKKLGLRTKTIATIIKYLSKGGHFYKADDLQKIYGLKPDEYTRIQPFIRIEGVAESNNTNQPNSSYHDNHPNPRRPLSASITDINLADTTALIALPGIGSKLANRIINFRDRLGGFYSIDQVGETYGLADSSFQKIKPLLKIAAQVRKININSAEPEALKSHPYIKWNIANALVQYRQQHGPFKSVEELQQIAVVTPAVYQKLAPYITVE